MKLEEVISNYIEKRDRKKEIEKRHTDELAALNNAMEQIENFLLHHLNSTGAESVKTTAGTAFKVKNNSVQMLDPVEFKKFIFSPATDGIVTYLNSVGYEINSSDAEKISDIVRDLAAWDMVDFRAGKKGITEYVANENKPVPGVAINSSITLNIRRA